MGVPVLIVNIDSSERRRLRQPLESKGYSVVEAEDAESGMAILRSSGDGMVVLFSVVLHNNVITGTDGISLLGAAASDRRLARQNAFVVTTPNPELVYAALGRLLDHLGIAMIGQPCETSELLHTVAGEARRLLVTV